MSQGKALYELWNNEKDGCFWMVHTIRVFDKKEIENMHFKQLDWLFKKIIAYEDSIKKHNKIQHNIVDGFKLLQKCLREKEISYYNKILYTKYSTSSMTANDIKRCFMIEEGVTKTYKEIYDEAAMYIRTDYRKKNKANYLELKKITEEMNFKNLYEQRKKELHVLDDLTAGERSKYYEAKLLLKDPKKVQERKEIDLLRLKEWKTEDPERYAKSQAKYRAKKQDLTICETTEELAVKVVRLAIAKALKKLADAERHKFKQLI
jgi:hypothetical protein